MKDLIPILICRDVQAAVRFYVEILGFKVINRMDDVGRSGFASLRHGQAQIMLASPTYVPEAPQVEGRYTQAMHYFYPEDVVALRAQVEEAGAKPGEMVVRFYGMKEFELVDPEGHVLVFGQETDEAPTPE